MMSKHLAFCLKPFLLSFVFLISFAAEAMIVPGSMEYLQEPRSQNPLTKNEAYQSPGWQKTTPDKTNFGFTKDYYWLKFDVINDHPGEKSLIVEIDNPQLDDLLVTAFPKSTPFGSQMISYTLGTSLPFDDRPLAVTTFAVPLPLAYNEVYTVLLRANAEEGVILPVKTWAPGEFDSFQSSTLALKATLFGALAAICIYNLFLFISTGYIAYLYYSAFIFATFLVNGVMTGLMFQFLVTTNYKIIKLGAGIWMCSAVIFGALFIRDFLELEKHGKLGNRIIRLILWIQSLVIVIGLFTPYDWTVKITTAAVVAGAFMPIIFSIVLFKKSRQAKFLLASFVLLSIGGVAFGSAKAGFLPFNMFTANGLQIGNFSEAMLLSLALGDRLNQLKRALSASNESLVKLNDGLETLVKEKTRSIRTILDSIPQGVFAIEKNLTIHNEVSGHLYNLVEEKEIAGKNLRNIFLNRTTLNSDAIDRIQNTLMVAIGDSELNFELNSDNLPSEVDFKSSVVERKILGLTWDPVMDDNDEVLRVLVTVLDVTRAKEMEKQLQAQQAGLQRVKELIDCGEQKFAQFAMTVEPLIHENIRLIDACIEHDESDSTVKILFVNAHTAKGAARTLGLSFLSNTLHETEQYYVDLMKRGAELSMERLKTEIQNVKTSFDEYVRVNTQELGRTFDPNVISVKKDFLFSQFDMLLRLTKLKFVGQESSVLSEISKSIDEISALVCRKLVFLLEDSFSQLGKIAKDLGKLPPELVIESKDYTVSENVEDILRKITIHIARNIMDHGIEGSEERLSKGKNEKGKIFIQTEPVDETLIKIRIQDDGRGLAIGKIRTQALNKGLISENATPAEIAETIFQVGVSTAASVSHISGRGVGMDAVRKFVEQGGGKLWLHLDSKLDDAGNYYKFCTVIELPIVNVSTAMPFSA